MEKSTKASATASSTSEPVFRTRMALTEDDNRLDWLIPYPEPNWPEKEGKQPLSSHRCNNARVEGGIQLLLRGKEKKPMGQSILKAILYFFWAQWGFGQVKGKKQSKWLTNEKQM